MQNNNSDIFEGKIKNINTNFFLTEEVPPVQNPFPANNENSRRLNDYDFNLLKEDAYKDVTDDLFKLEYKISKTEEEIKNIQIQIQAAEDIQDYYLVEELINRKTIIEDDYNTLLSLYREKSLSAKISGSMINKLKGNFNSINNKLSIFSEKIVSKLPKKLTSILELKKSLAKLENINKSVDELVKLNIPYGENVNKYEQLSRYIIKANSLQNEISKHIKRGS